MTTIADIHGTQWAITTSDWPVGYGIAQQCEESIVAELRKLPADIIQRIHAEYLDSISSGDELMVPQFIQDICARAKTMELGVWHHLPKGDYQVEACPRLGDDWD